MQASRWSLRRGKAEKVMRSAPLARKEKAYGGDNKGRRERRAD
jgi:hypothetical protein